MERGFLFIKGVFRRMKCWHCKHEIIWGGDHDFEDYGYEGKGIVSNFHCPNCGANYECRYPIECDECKDKTK